MESILSRKPDQEKEPSLVEEVLGDEIDYEDQPVVHDELSADKHLGFLGHWQREYERIERLGQMQIEELQRRLKRRLEIIDNKIAWHEVALGSWFKTTGSKKWQGVNGEIKVRTGSERIEIKDEQVLLSWINAGKRDGMTRVKIEFDKRAIMNAIKDSGEIPPGTDLVRGDAKVVIKPS